MHYGGDMITWSDVKKSGSEHYKTGGVEPIDLYKSAGFAVPFCLCSIIKYAFRNIKKDCVSVSDINKIKHYCDMVISITQEQGGVNDNKNG